MRKFLEDLKDLEEVTEHEIYCTQINMDIDTVSEVLEFDLLIDVPVNTELDEHFEEVFKEAMSRDGYKSSPLHWKSVDKRRSMREYATTITIYL